MRLAVGALALALAACGGSGTRQDEDEPSGKFPVEIITSQFPTRQRLAEASELRLGIRNTGERAVPALVVTISLDKNARRPFSIHSTQPGLADPDRPVWVLEEDYPKLVGEAVSAGAQTANEKTFDFGSLAAGKTVEAVWKVTPIRGGIYTLDYQVDAGLFGNATAVTDDGSPPTGSFAVRISTEPPETRINDKGQVIEVPEAGSSSAKNKGGGSG